jgi:DNA-directed RNA polymerase specialized sigma24 family protein
VSLSDQDGTAGPTGSDRQQMPATDDLTSFTEMFDAHAEHLFDYCNSLLADQEEAASAAEAILIAAQSILQDREKMRTWLFTLARRECILLSPEKADGDIEDLPGAGASEAASGSPGEPMPPLRALPQRQREALNLVHRYGILPDDLATVLGVPPEEAQALLEAAEADIGLPADAAAGYAVVQAEERLATLPPSIWRRTTTALFGIELARRNGDGSRAAGRLSDRFQRQPGSSARGRNRLAIGAAALIPLAAGAAGLLYFTHPSGAASSPGGDRVSATTPADPANSPAAAASSRNAAEHGPARHKSAAFPARPAPGTHASSSTRKPKPKPKPSRSASPKHTTSGSPAPTTSLGSPPSPSSPSPSPTSPSPSSPSPSAS